MPHPPEGKTNENNNEPVEAQAHDKVEATAEVDEIAGTDNKSLVYADVIQLWNYPWEIRIDRSGSKNLVNLAELAKWWHVLCPPLVSTFLF